jgi:hypothetical protein
MRRREFIKLIAGATVAWPFLAQAQQNKIYRIGYLSPGVPAKEAPGFDAFQKMLAALGYIEGRNLVIEERWLNGGKYEQLISMAAELASESRRHCHVFDARSFSRPARYNDDPNRLSRRRRCRRCRPRIKLVAAWRECDRQFLLDSGACIETAGTIEGDDTRPEPRCRVIQF